MFIFFFVDTWGRKPSLFVSAIGMGTLFFIVGAILKTHPPASTSQPNPLASGRAMAAMIYIYVCFYSMGWGPLPWVYVSDIFPTRTRHYGLAVASSSQWLWSVYFLNTYANEKSSTGISQTSSCQERRRPFTQGLVTRCSCCSHL
jgi:MFS family permease